MYDSLREKINADHENGKKIEVLFIELMEKLGYCCYKATSFQNIHEHWDVLTAIGEKDNRIFDRVDVKGMKHITEDGRTWMEYKNVKGDTGWLCSEYMDTIAFELKDCFVLINRSKLKDLVDVKIQEAIIEDGEDIVYCDKNGLKDYRKYSRVGRQDLIVKAVFKDFEHLIHKKIYK
jgi:hypothetical protein